MPFVCFLLYAELSWSNRTAWVGKDLKDHQVSIPQPQAGLSMNKSGQEL